MTDPAFAQDLLVFSDERIEALRKEGRKRWVAGDQLFLARQHAHFLRSYQDCKCDAHSCNGCKVTLRIACAFEKDISTLDPDKVLQAEASAMAMRDAEEAHHARLLRRAAAGHEQAKEDRRSRSEDRRSPRSRRGNDPERYP